MPDPFVGPLQQFNYPAGPVTPPNLTGGSASDALRALLGYSANRTAAADSQATDMFAGRGLAGGAYANAIGNQNTAVGLSPEAMAALRTQGTSGINDQYQSAAQALNSQLLRHGATGNAQLPGYGGDISRAYQPLYSAMEAAKSKAQQDTILADEAAKQKSLYQNQQLALQAAQGLNSGATSLFNAGTGALGQSGGIAQALAQLEGPNIWKLLGTQGLTSLLSGTGAVGAGVSELEKLLGLNNADVPPGLLDSLKGAIPSGVLGSVPGSTPTMQGGLPLPSEAPTLPPDFGAPVAQAAGEVGGIGAAAAAIPGGAAPATGITGALGLGGGAGLFGLGAATIPVVGGAVAGIALLANHFFGNGGDRKAADKLTGPGGVHDFFNQATQQVEAMPEGSPERAAASDARDRQFEQALLDFSKVSKDNYYQAQKTLRQFSAYSSVRPLLG